jgi:MYXO-CTERM domain-containing protein
VQIRFRAGSDDNTTDVGWEIDDIELLDVTSKPFWSFIPHRDQCDPLGPKVEAGPGQTVHAKDPVTLQGSGAHPKNAPLTFFWTQTAGPTVQMRGENTATLAFDAPDTKDPVKLTFALRAHDGSLLSAASYVDVTVTNGDVTNNPGGGGGEGSSGCGCTATGSASSNLGAIALAGIAATFVRRRRRS